MCVRFPVGSVFSYQASRAAAAAFTAAMRQWDDKILVTVDAAVSTRLPVLPCHELYEA